MATKESATNISTLQWVIGLLLGILLILASFSGSQVVQKIEDSETAREASYKAISEKMETIVKQTSGIDTEIRLLQKELIDHKDRIAKLEKEVMELKLDKARYGR